MFPMSPFPMNSQPAAGDAGFLTSNSILTFENQFSNATPVADTMKSLDHSTFKVKRDSSESILIPEFVKERDADALLANELNQMSLEERERTYEEIHGVGRILEETPDMIDRHLRQMDEALGRLPLNAAYMMAFQRDPEYITNPRFRLMFLRSTNFNVELAAQKLLDFLQGKLELFGQQTLTRSLYLSDLDPDDLACLKSGAYQLLPGRDSAGRAVIVDFHLIVEQCYKHPKNLLRTVAFLQLAAAEDEETQKRGEIGVVYYVGKFNGQFNHPLNKQVAAMLKWFPIKLTGYHMCFDTPQIRSWKPLAMMLMGRKIRIRARFHEGAHTEVRYSLMTFGVPVDVLPISYQGEVKTSNHAKWIARRRSKEDHLQAKGHFDGIDLPARKDVILRRGRVFHDHPGNVRMRHMIDMAQEEYTEAPLKQKTMIANRIVNQIKSDGGRFLECDAQGWWIPVDDKEACKRVSKAIRSMRTASAAAKRKDDDSLEHREKRSKLSVNETSIDSCCM